MWREQAEENSVVGFELEFGTYRYPIISIEQQT
jgi:hypothetical protein